MKNWEIKNNTDVYQINEPMFKFFKKKKECYSTEISDTWYKSPYKYHFKVISFNNLN
jgi:hypothetical protein